MRREAGVAFVGTLAGEEIMVEEEILADVVDMVEGETLEAGVTLVEEVGMAGEEITVGEEITEVEATMVHRVVEVGIEETMAAREGLEDVVVERPVVLAAWSGARALLSR